MGFIEDLKHKLGIDLLYEQQKKTASEVEQFGNQLAACMQELKHVQQAQEQMQKELLKINIIEEELSEVKAAQKKMESEYAALEEKIQNTDKSVKDMQERLRKDVQVLNGKIQNTDKWLKDTRETLWDNTRALDEKIQNTDKWLKGTRKTLWDRVQVLDEKIQSTDQWAKDTREKLSDVSKKMSAFHSEQWNHTFQLRKLEYQQRRYLPEDKYALAIKDWYYSRTGRELDLDNPKTYNEIVQWDKLRPIDPLKVRLADKYRVRSWIKEKIGEEYLIPLLGVYEKPEDIKFEELPQQFVLKCNHGCGYNIIVKDKGNMDQDEVRLKLRNWLNEDFSFKQGFELQYSQIKPCIIAEKYMLSEDMDDLPDYKFFCFGGKVFCSFTIDTIKERHADGRLGIFDRDYHLLPYCRQDFRPITEQLEKPANYEKMVEFAEILAEGFPHVRVDFYNIKGKIYFGEMTFTTASGTGFFEPEEFDYILGEQWMKYLPEL